MGGRASPSKHTRNGAWTSLAGSLSIESAPKTQRDTNSRDPHGQADATSADSWSLQHEFHCEMRAERVTGEGVPHSVRVCRPPHCPHHRVEQCAGPHG